MWWLLFSQVIQTVSAVDKDEPLSGHRFFFSLAAPVASNLNFTLRDNKGTFRDVFCFGQVFHIALFFSEKCVLKSPEFHPLFRMFAHVLYQIFRFAIYCLLDVSVAVKMILISKCPNLNNVIISNDFSAIV